jgi:hypothetical protein
MTINLENLLRRTADAIERESDLSHITSGESFEKYVFDKMNEVATRDYGLPQKFSHTGKLAFPDIVVDDMWGVEVKYSNSGHWNSLGNSIFESTSVEGLQEIYVLFGKKNGNKIEVRFDLYENVVTDVKVTHSPRFIVNLEDDTKSLFSELDMKYNDFKTLDKSLKGKHIKDYFRKHLKPGDDVWWIDKEETATMPKLKLFSNLEPKEKASLLVEAFILFPEVLSNSTAKYNRIAPYWLTQHQVYNPSLRDQFSASGRVGLSVPPIAGKIKVSKIYGGLHKSAFPIKSTLTNPDDDFLEIIKEKWETDIDPEKIKKDNLLDIWLTLIDRYGVSPYEGINPSDVFRAGLLWWKDVSEH